jgi:hypothetical protein
MKNFLKKLVKPIIILCITAAILTPVIQVANAADELLPRWSDLDIMGLPISADGEYLETTFDQVSTYDKLPTFDEKIIFRSAIKTMLYLAGFLATLGLIVVGYMFMVGAANEESLTKARKLLGYLGIGILIIAASYAIISGILQIKLF